MERVRQLSSEDAVVIFAVSNDCPLSNMVTALFSDLGASAAVHELDKDPWGRDMEGALARACEATFPIVFIGGKLIGSTDAIMSLHLAGSLVPVLKASGAIQL